jgi:hypothetical protein
MPLSLQHALSNLAPRDAGRIATEPRVTFDMVQETLHAAERCPYTCGGGCSHGTEMCTPTGHTV